MTGIVSGKVERAGRPAERHPDHPRTQGRDSGPIWLGHTPTGDDLEGMPLDWFHQAVDQLERDTVPRSYWQKVVARRQAEAWDVR